MEAGALYNAALAVFLGLVGQVLGRQLAIPSIILLLVIGVAAGPDGLALLEPQVFGSAIGDIVALAVTVILFEGALALRMEEIRGQQRSLTLLLTLGSLISMIIGTLVAHYLVGLSWSVATLYGSLMIVTGPTVVTPLLSRLTIDRKVRELLISEGVLIDPIGAIVAIVVADSVLGHSGVWEVGGLVFVRLAIGGAIGAAAGIALAISLRRDWIPEDLRNPVVLGALLLAAGLASRLSSEAGLMAAVAQGITLANAGVRGLGPLRQFKEELTIFLLSFIFVLLAADLPIDQLIDLGPGAILAVLILIWVARPLAVYLCTLGSDLTMQQRLFVAWMSPRGIVAASVAGLFAISLGAAGIEEGAQLEALVFLTVGMTVALQGSTAGRVAHLLGIDRPPIQGAIIVGANYFGRLLGRLLMILGRQVVLVDLNPHHCRAAREAGLPVLRGDALDIDVLEEAGAIYAHTVLASTANQELNTLVGQTVDDNFRVDRVITLDAESSEDRSLSAMPGSFPGLDEVNRLLRLGKGRVIDYSIPQRGDKAPGTSLGQLEYADGEFALVLMHGESIYVATGDLKIAPGDRLICLRTSNDASPLAQTLVVEQEIEARKVKQFVLSKLKENT